MRKGLKGAALQQKLFRFPIGEGDKGDGATTNKQGVRLKGHIKVPLII